MPNFNFAEALAITRRFVLIVKICVFFYGLRLQLHTFRFHRPRPAQQRYGTSIREAVVVGILVRNAPVKYVNGII